MCILLQAFISRDDLIIEFLKHFPYLKTVKNILFKIPYKYAGNGITLGVYSGCCEITK